MAEVVVTEFMDPEAVELLAAHHTVIDDPTLVEDRNRLIGMLADADALIVRNRTRVDAALLEAAPRLQVVGRLGVGLDNIDTAACDTRDVTVRTAGGANAVSVAEHVIGALLSLARPAFRATERILAGEWPRTEMVGVELAGRSLGLVGLGATAREVARRATAMGMTVLAHDPFVSSAPPGITLMDLDDLFEAADAMSVHVPFTPDTANLIDASRLRLLPEGALLVDTSRGGIVSHEAVVDALRSGHLGGAALDVFAEEPPNDVSAYADVPNLILTPHVAGITRESNVRVSRTVAEAVLEVLDRS